MWANLVNCDKLQGADGTELKDSNGRCDGLSGENDGAVQALIRKYDHQFCSRTGQDCRRRICHHKLYM